MGKETTLAHSFESKNKENPNNENDVMHFLPGLIDGSVFFFFLLTLFCFCVLFCLFILTCPSLGNKS